MGYMNEVALEDDLDGHARIVPFDISLTDYRMKSISLEGFSWIS